MRHFDSTNEVLDRYGAFFEHQDLVAFMAPGPRSNPVLRYFLMDGIRG